MYNRYIRTICAAILLAAAVSAPCSARAMAAETKAPVENITADMPQAEESCAAENSVPVDAAEDGNDVSCGDTGRGSAYDDIAEAFRYYLENENKGRPIVLAGFSQGADMCYRLLADYFGTEDMQEKLVAVYALGWPCTIWLSISDVSG